MCYFVYVFFDFIFFLGFLFFKVSGVDDKIARVFIRVRFLRVCVSGFFYGL